MKPGFDLLLGVFYLLDFMVVLGGFCLFFESAVIFKEYDLWNDLMFLLGLLCYSPRNW